MKKRIKEFFEKQGYDSKSFTLVIVFILIVFIIIAGYFLFLKTKPCNDESCFYNAIDNGCKKVSWIRGDEEAVWQYIIKGREENKCSIEVQLLDMKKGLIDIEKLQNKKMICNLLPGDKIFPEKDIANCKGELKEELQDILIQRMHNYLLKNIGEIQKGFKEI